MLDRAMQREPGPRRRSSYVDADTLIQVLEAQLARGDYLLGARLSAADFLWGSSLGWLSNFGMLRPEPATAA